MELNDLQKMMYHFKPALATCYNPKTSMIEWSVCDRFQKIRIRIAPTLNKDASGRAQKGEKRFDHENAAIFSLNVEECWQVITSIGAVVKGEYNQNDQKEQNRGKLIITHYREDKPSLLVFEPAKRDNQLTGSIRITIIPPKGEGNWVSYTFRPLELKRFGSFIRNCAENLEFIAAINECFKSTLNSAIYYYNNDKQGSNRNSYNNTQNNQPKNQYNEPDYYTGPDINSDMNSDISSDLDDIF